MYVESGKLPDLVYKDGTEPDRPCQGSLSNAVVKEHVEVGVIGCRRNALYHADYLPMFSPPDDAKPAVEGQLPDLVYMDHPSTATDLQSLVAQLPYGGLGWYSKPAAEWLLHSKKACWADFKLGITASARITGDDFRAAFDFIKTAFDQTEIPGEDPFKFAMNAWIGLCSIWKRSSPKSHLSTNARGFACWALTIASRSDARR